METAHRNDWHQGLYCIYYSLLPIEKSAFKRQTQTNTPLDTAKISSDLLLSLFEFSGRHLPIKFAAPAI
jgi:hypothetical protein